MSIPAWISSLQRRNEHSFYHLERTEGFLPLLYQDRRKEGGGRVFAPYDIDVSVLGSQMQRRDTVGVGGFRFQHGRTHVAAEQELDHLPPNTGAHSLSHLCTCGRMQKNHQLAGLWGAS